MFITHHAVIFLFFNVARLCDTMVSWHLYGHSFRRDIHPDGLPSAYTIILMFRLLPDSPKEAFDIWQVSDKNNKPETGVTIDRKSSVTFSHPYMHHFPGNGKTVRRGEGKERQIKKKKGRREK